MRLRKVKNALEKIQEYPNIVIQNATSNKGKWNEVFGNNNPIYIEIGMGKGDFIIENAKTYPNINFIGIEKFDSVIVRAIQKSNELELDNLKIIRIDANKLDEIFDKEIDTIYLNFSDPWPKDRHAKRRLTSPIFLSIYDKEPNDGVSNGNYYALLTYANNAHLIRINVNFAEQIISCLDNNDMLAINSNGTLTII